MKPPGFVKGELAHPYCKLAFLVSILLLISAATFVSAAGVSEQPSADCGECHGFRMHMIKAYGGEHGTEISCLDCHSQHEQGEKSETVACSECHEGEDHYQVKDCLHCHMNPHKPIESLRDPLKPARKECISCHADVGTEMTQAPSRHSKLYCTRCHDSHQFVPSCLDCHNPHLVQQTDYDCLHCHPAHSPLKIEPTGYTPRTFCQVCHIEEARNLANTRTNHRWLNCVYCHKGPHTSSPNCRDCHGLPHTPSTHSQERECLACHSDVHLLIIEP
jgi:hypothetical protein